MFSIKAEFFVSPTFFSLHSKAEECMSYLRETNLTHLPIVDESNLFLGSLLAEDIETLEDSDTLEELGYELEHFQLIYASDISLFETLNLFSSNDTNILPVVDRHRKLVSLVLKDQVLSFWNETTFIDEPGEYIVVSKKYDTYSLSEITQLVESNNAKLYGILILSREEDYTYILLKTNQINTNAILDDLRRHGYIIDSNNIDDMYRNELKERSNYLNKYMNI
ncbi:CBS domain-containing protein [Myroides pelagicus]|uniref:CBS domain-containing protein n=1 Tax=Myroides pelagicus TaxID=270914 RepID=A0A7K1GJT8_9FLAO|nr:CBS domain-containing protein [Myroides pelagicus]MEC4112873.1 CBS domain-containing protein [Myroides pelagicus]MTH28683.1 CBS domain-containing protein [Myroides pelagicus]